MMMRFQAPAVALLFWLLSVVPAAAQFRKPDPETDRLGTAEVQRWRAGIMIKAPEQACQKIMGYAPLPVEWPEQEVRIVDEEVSPSVEVSYEEVDGGVKVMIVSIPYLAPGEVAKALVTVEVRRSAQSAPENTDVYRLPDPRKLDRSFGIYLGASPQIETRASKIRRLAREIGAEEKSAWKKVEAIYDWVRENVEYQKEGVKGASAALRAGKGDHEDLASLFIAICRAADVPARTVWVKGSCYAEFYLVDEEDQGHWFPCQMIGNRAFGEMSDHRPILQKGDNFRPPYNRRDRQRYLAEYLTVSGGRPKYKFVREVISE